MSGGQRTRYEVKDASGALVAVHVRVDGPATIGDTTIPAGEKAVYWVAPDGRKGLEATGFSLVDLPLYAIDRIEQSPVVVITEGEKAAEALIGAGVTAVGTVTGAASTPTPKVLAELNGRHVVLWPDNDPQGEAHMQRVATGLTGIAATVRWATWDEAPAHGDAADYLFTNGASTGRDPWDIIDASGPVPSHEVRFEKRGLGYWGFFPDGRVEFTFDRIRHRSGETHGEVTVRCGHAQAPGDGHLAQGSFNLSGMTARSSLAKQIAERAPAVKGVDWREHVESFSRKVLAAEREGTPFTAVGGRPAREQSPYVMSPLLFRDRASILYGPGGTGKSYLAAAIAVSKASGVEVIEGWRPDRPGNVLVLDWEADADEWNERINLVSTGAGIDPPTIDYRFNAAPFTDGVEDVARYVIDRKIELLVIDSVGAASPMGREGGDANEGALRFFQALRYIRCTALLIDHVTGDDAGSERGAAKPYGSVYKVNLARNTFELRRKDDDENDTVGHLLLVNRKVNNARRVKPTGLRIEHGPDYVKIDPEVIEEPSLRAAVPLTQLILDAIAPGPLTRKEITDQTEANASSIGVVLSRMVERGAIVRLPSGQYALAARDVA